MTWKERVLQTLNKSKDKVVEIDIDKEHVPFLVEIIYGPGSLCSLFRLCSK